MSVVLALEDLGPCKKRLKIEVPGPAVDAEAGRVVEEYARKVRIPGFRKGKVPSGLVRRQYGEEIRRETIERVVPRYFRLAMAEKALEPLGSPRVADVHHHDGEAMTFSAEVEVRPEFELRNYKDFALAKVEVEPSADEIESMIETLRKGAADWSKVERAAADGDRAELELVETTAGAAGEPQSATIEIGSARVWDELNAAARGLLPGQRTTFARGEGEGDARVERSFELKLLSLEAAQLPPLDDALAAKIGKFETLDALRSDIAGRLRAARLEEADAERERQLLDQLVERHPMPLPDGVVRSETEELLREYAEGLARRGVDLEKAEIDWQKMGEEAKPHAERRVKARLLLDAIADKESISVGEEEFEQALAVLARVQGLSSGALRQRLDANGALHGLRAKMRREKTVRYLLAGETVPAETAG